MEWLQRNWPKLSGIGGTVITIAGLVTFQTWRDRLGEIGWAIHDNPLPAGAVVFGIVLLTIANWDRIRSTVIESKRWRTDQELNDELYGWLRQAGFTLVDTPLDAATKQDIAFAFTATRHDRPTTIIRPHGDPGVLLQTIVKPSAPHDTIIENMTEDQRSALTEEIGIELARYGLGFDARELLDVGIALQYPLLLTDALTQWQFVDRVNFVARGIMLMQMIVTRHCRIVQAQGGVSPNLVPVPQSSSDTEAIPTE